MIDNIFLRVKQQPSLKFAIGKKTRGDQRPSIESNCNPLACSLDPHGCLSRARIGDACICLFRRPIRQYHRIIARYQYKHNRNLKQKLVHQTRFISNFLCISSIARSGSCWFGRDRNLRQINGLIVTVQYLREAAH